MPRTAARHDASSARRAPRTPRAGIRQQPKETLVEHARKVEEAIERNNQERAARRPKVRAQHLIRAT
jgi:hypothetical protein